MAKRRQDATETARIGATRERGVVIVPELQHWPPAGVYQLHLRLRRRAGLRIGRLGKFVFPPGTYVYTGRAARGLAARVLRHARCARRDGGRRRVVRHWHIDYLLADAAVELECIVLASDAAADECRVNQAGGGDVVIPGFGASDCRSRCGSHLHWRPLPP